MNDAAKALVTSVSFRLRRRVHRRRLGRRRRDGGRAARRRGPQRAAARGRRRPAQADRRRPRRRRARTACPTTTTSRRSTRSRPRTRRCAGTSSSATTPITSSRARPEVRRRRRRAARGRRAVPARRHARRLHRAQRDDLVYPHDCRLGSVADLTGDPSLARRADARLLRALENCRHLPLERALAGSANPTRHGWDGWLQTEKAIAERRDHAIATCHDDSRFGACRARAALSRPTDSDGAPARDQLDPNDWRVVSDDHGLRYTPLTTRKHQRVGTRERLLEVAKQHPDRLKIELQRARHAGAVRRRAARDRRRVPGGERLYGATRVRAPARRAARRCSRRARSSSPAAPSTRRSC